jgi:hypothetical protein
MSSRTWQTPEHRSPRELRLWAIVDSLVTDSSQKAAYLAFAHELVAAERRQPQASSHKLQAPDFSRRTKRVVEKWFRRGLSGHLMWLIGEAVLGKARITKLE